MKRHLFCLLFPFLLISCKNSSETENTEIETATGNFSKMERMQWLLGTWVNDFTPEFSQESWKRENDSTFRAFSFTTVNQDTVFAETMALQQRRGNLFLTVSEASNKNPITFGLVSSEDGAFVFENKDHDFPQRIVYTNPVPDSLHAWIEGPLEGEMKTLHFYFSKEK